MDIPFVRKTGPGQSARVALLLVGLTLLAGCGGGSKSNRTPVDLRGDAIRPVDAAPPAGTLAGTAPGSQPERFTLRRSNERPVRDDTVARVDPPPRAVTMPDSVPPTPPRTVTMSPPAVANPPADAVPAPVMPAAPSSRPDSARLLQQEPPQVISRVPPVYPDRARQARVGGTVLVKALVGTDGDVRATRIARSIPELDSAAIACVKKWKFKPAMSSGVRVAAWTDVPVRFLLQSQ